MNFNIPNALARDLLERVARKQAAERETLIPVALLQDRELRPVDALLLGHLVRAGLQRYEPDGVAWIPGPPISAISRDLSISRETVRRSLHRLATSESVYLGVRHPDAAQRRHRDESWQYILDVGLGEWLDQFSPGGERPGVWYIRVPGEYLEQRRTARSDRMRIAAMLVASAARTMQIVVGGEWFKSVSTLSHMLGMSRDTVERSINWLVKKKYLIPDGTNNYGKQIYRIYDEPHDEEEIKKEIEKEKTKNRVTKLANDLMDQLWDCTDTPEDRDALNSNINKFLKTKFKCDKISDIKYKQWERERGIEDDDDHVVAEEPPENGENPKKNDELSPDNPDNSSGGHAVAGDVLARLPEREGEVDLLFKLHKKTPQGRWRAMADAYCRESRKWNKRDEQLYRDISNNYLPDETQLLRQLQRYMRYCVEAGRSEASISEWHDQLIAEAKRRRNAAQKVTQANNVAYQNQCDATLN